MAVDIVMGITVNNVMSITVDIVTGIAVDIVMGIVTLSLTYTHACSRTLT